MLYEHYFLLYRQVNSIHVLVMQLYIQLHNAFVWNKQLLKTNGLFGYCYFWHFYTKYRQCLSISITLKLFLCISIWKICIVLSCTSYDRLRWCMYILQFCEYFLNDSFSPSDRSIFPIFSSHLIFVIDIHVQYPRQLFFFPERMQKCVKGREIFPPYGRLFIKAWKIIWKMLHLVTSRTRYIKK